MNHMEEVAKMLGVELDEKFKCNNSPCMYCITKYGCTCNGVYAADSLMMLLDGTLIIEHKPWRPKEDEKYYVVLCDGSVGLRYWEDCTPQINYYKLGNFYRTEEEAESNRDKWVAFYASDEVLEV